MAMMFPFRVVPSMPCQSHELCRQSIVFATMDCRMLKLYLLWAVVVFTGNADFYLRRCAGLPCCCILWAVVVFTGNADFFLRRCAGPPICCCCAGSCCFYRHCGILSPTLCWAVTWQDFAQSRVVHGSIRLLISGSCCFYWHRGIFSPTLCWAVKWHEFAQSRVVHGSIRLLISLMSIIVTVRLRVFAFVFR